MCAIVDKSRRVMHLDARMPNHPVRTYSAISIAPCTISAAKRQVKAWHRHLPNVQGGLFAVQVIDGEGQCVGVGVFGNPARVWQGTGRGVIVRCATEGADNACSMVYGALCRAAKALGYREAWTYTLPEESGASLRAAGFMDMGITTGGDGWLSRAGRKVVRPEPKRRWLRRLAAPIEEARPPRPVIRFHRPADITLLIARLQARA